MLGGRRAVEGPTAFKDKVEKIHLYEMPIGLRTMS
jgi:hypothetical protein